MSSLLLCLVATATVTSSCGPKRVVVNGREMTYEEGAEQVYREGREARERGDLATARARYKEVVDLFEESRQVPHALGDLAGMLFEDGGCPAARIYLERLVEGHASSPQGQRARDRLAECRGGPPVAASEEGPLATFRRQYEQAATPAEKKEVASRAADASAEAGDHGGAVRWLLLVMELETDSAQKEALRAEVAELIDHRLSAKAVRQLLETRGGKDFPKELLLYKLGRIQYHVRDLISASETLRQYLAEWPGGAHVADAQALLARIEAHSKVSPRTVGVVLPLSGRHRSYGEQALQAIQLALNLDDKNRGNPSINLVVKDTKSDRVRAAEVVEELVLEDGAIAILGPMFTYEAEPAAYKAQELGVPILTISAAEDLPQIGPHVFRNGLTNRAQMEALVRHAMEVEGMKTFAVLYPRHPYGEELLHLFWDEVDKRQGELRGVEIYNTDETTFSPQVKRLVARDRLDLRGDYHRALAECNKIGDTFRRAKCKDNVGKDVKPIVDFDGLFIPDGPKKIAMISAALAFEDVIVEKDPRRLRVIEKTLGRTVKPVTLLGPSVWNAPELVEQAGRNVENAVFVDGFFAQADDKGTAEFVEAYRKRFNRVPRLYPEALFFDSARLLGNVLANDKPASREELRQALRRVDGFPGVTGRTSFARGTDADKSIRVLTVRSGMIQEIPPPEAAPPVAPAE